jgi:hypothetical protein
MTTDVELLIKALSNELSSEEQKRTRKKKKKTKKQHYSWIKASTKTLIDIKQAI